MTPLTIALIFAVVGALGYLAFSSPTPPAGARSSQLAHLFDISFVWGMFAIVCILCNVAR